MSHTTHVLTSAADVAGVVVLSALGGTVRFLQGIKSKEFGYSRFCFLTEITTSVFVGVVTYVLCEGMEVDHFITAALVALAGHEGGRTLYVIHAALARRIRILKLLEKRCGREDPESCNTPKSGDPPGRDLSGD